MSKKPEGNFRNLVIPRLAILAVALLTHSANAQRIRELQERIDNSVREYCAIEYASQEEIRAPQGSTILWMAEDGFRVRKGDLIMRLDSARLTEKFEQQKIVYATVLSEFVKAKTALEFAKRRRSSLLSAAAKSVSTAKLALKNFASKEGVAASERMMAEAELASAQEKLKILEAIREGGTAMVALQIIDAKLAVTAGKQKLKQLKELHHPLQQAELEAELASKMAEMEEMESAFEMEIVGAEAALNRDSAKQKLEQVRLERLKQQIEACSVQAPADGIFRSVETRRSVIQEGSVVREGQVVAQLVDGDNFQARTLVNESRIGKVRPGQPVVISIAALAGQKIKGEVLSINEFPEPNLPIAGNNVKKYAVIVKLIDPPKEIRPGMTAMAEIRLK